MKKPPVRTTIASATSELADRIITNSLIAGVMRESEMAYLTMDKSYRDTWAQSDWINATYQGVELALVYFMIVRGLIKQAVGGEDNDWSTDMSLEAQHHLHAALGDSRSQEHVRVKKTGSGYSIFMPCSGVVDDSLSLIFGNGYYRQPWQETKNSIEQTFPGFFNLEQPLDIHLGKALLDNLSFEGESLEDRELDPEALDYIKKGIRGFRAVATPSRRRFEKAMANPARVQQWDAEDFGDDQYAATQALNQAWTTRGVMFYAEFFIEKEAAEYITQEQGDNVRLSAIGEYAAATQSALFGGGNVPAHIISMKRIAEDNAKNGVEQSPRVDQFGVAVSQKGELYWIPEVKDPTFAEDSVEAGGTMPDGEWTMRDSVDPENTEFVQETLPTGQVVRKRKSRGTNQLVYTDWHNSKLAFTKDDARLHIFDISMFRPARPQNYARVLSANLHESTDLTHDILNSLQYVIQSAVKHGVMLPAGAEYEDEWFTSDEINRMRAGFREGQLGLGDCLAVMRRAAQRATRPDGTELTPQQFQLAEAYAGRNGEPNAGAKHKYPSLDMLSADSPIGHVRAMFAFFTEAARKFDENPDLAFGEFSIVNTLGMLAYLRIVISLGGQYEAVHAQDMEDRKLYLNPPLSAPDQIRVEDIPWVSGSVELMPHQVKVWNYMQHFPKNLVLNVAAGGGKTMLALLYLAYGLAQGKWKKPLIACPGNLIKNYIIDASWLFKGKMNIVVINNTTVNSKEWGEEKLNALIEHAPLNTLFITDYDFIVPKANSKRVVAYYYGNSESQISLNCEMLKKAAWDVLVADESHYLKEASSSRNREMNRLLSNIPYKVQMSGTYIADNLTDVVGEFGLLEPQVFGDKSDFIEEFYPDGTRYAPVVGAQKQIRERMAENAMYVQVDRKEWAALLPRRYDAFYPVEMTAKQKLVYHKIMQLAEAEFNKMLEENSELKDALEGGADEEAGEDLDGMAEAGQLGFYFQKLEQFISNPQNYPEIVAEDPRLRLSGADLISPKAEEIEKILRHHEQEGMPGKVLVWTQYVDSAKHLFDSMPDDLKAASVYYTAANQDAAMAEFEKNPRKRFMFGCEKSMNTGLNLQFCDMIARTESVWNWGTLEQGEARINRPRSNDPRKEENGGHGIHYAWVFCNKSMDVTKSSRMISKLVSTIKFYNSDNHAYMQIDEPPPIKLSRRNIFKVNDFRDGEDLSPEEQEEAAKRGELGCARYFKAYETYQQLEEREFVKFRENPDNHIEPYTLEEGHIPEGSGLLRRIPYMPGMKLWGQEKLGLVPYMEWAATTYAKRGGPSNWDDPEFSPEGIKIHCEFGDCIAIDYNRARKGSNVKPQSMRVRTPDDKTASVPLAATWVITKDVVAGRDIRQALAVEAHKDIDLSQEVVPEARVPVPRERPAVQEQEEETPANGKMAITIWAEAYDNHLAFRAEAEDPEMQDELAKQLHSMGFFQAPAFDYVKITRPDALNKWIAAAEKAGLKIDPKYRQLLQRDADMLAQHRDLGKFLSGISSAQRPTFFRQQMKPAPKGVIKPYLFVVLYPGETPTQQAQHAILAFSHRGNMASIPALRKIRVQGVSAVKGPRPAETVAMFNSKSEAQTMLRKLGSHYDVTNMKVAIKELSGLKFVPLKNPAQPPAV